MKNTPIQEKADTPLFVWGMTLFCVLLPSIGLLFAGILSHSRKRLETFANVAIMVGVFLGIRWIRALDLTTLEGETDFYATSIRAIAGHVLITFSQLLGGVLIGFGYRMFHEISKFSEASKPIAIILFGIFVMTVGFKVGYSEVQFSVEHIAEQLKEKATVR